MAMSTTLRALVDEAQKQGTLRGLPDRHFIAGQWVASTSGARLASLDPGTGEAFTEFAAGGADDVDAAVRAARNALTGPWKRATPAQRGRVLMRCAELIREHAERLAVVETLDSGKRLSEALGDVNGAARAFEY